MPLRIVSFVWIGIVLPKGINSYQSVHVVSNSLLLPHDLHYRHDVLLLSFRHSYLNLGAVAGNVQASPSPVVVAVVVDST